MLISRTGSDRSGRPHARVQIHSHLYRLSLRTYFIPSASVSSSCLFQHCPWHRQQLTKQLPFVRWPDIGAGNQLWAATMPVTQARELSGSYIVPFQRVGRARPDSLKVANQVRLWDWCEEQVKRHI